MTNYMATEIDWDTDGEDVDLPDAWEVTLEDGATAAEIIDAVSDESGWCIHECRVWVETGH